MPAHGFWKSMSDIMLPVLPDPVCSRKALSSTDVTDDILVTTAVLLQGGLMTFQRELTFRVYGNGSFVPEQVLTNDHLSASLNTSDEWIRSRTGIGQRHVAEASQYTSDLALNAARASLASAGLDPQDLDGLVLATTTPDYSFPATATQIQGALGARGFAFDVQAACGGFPLAMITAAHWIRGGQARRVMVIGADTMSRLTDWTDRRTAVLFGDGAGAVIVEGVPACEGSEPDRLEGLFECDGKGFQALYVDGGVSRTRQAGLIRMEGREVFRHAVERMSEASLALMERQALTVHDIDWLIPHQANARIMDSVAHRLGFPADKVVSTTEHYANTSAASIPLALDYGVRTNRIHAGHKILCPAFGAGFAWGAVLFRWHGSACEPVQNRLD